jgi:hypothetical protein
MSPKITPSYRICPRCDQRDNYYLAPRVVGQVGIARNFEIGDAEFLGGGAKSVEAEVELCKNCGERVKYVAEVVEYSPEETRQLGKQGVKSGLVTFVISSLVAFYVGRHYINLYEESYPWLIAAVTSTMTSLISLVYVFSSAIKSLK